MSFCCSLQDVPKPLFMSTKEPNDWTEDEQKLAKEYEKKVKDLQEEREKYRKVSVSAKRSTLVQKGQDWCRKVNVSTKNIFSW